ncbi:MAG: hypothetical protein ACREKL_04510, partial [Chthoniobacterales bacterium]
MNEDDKNLHPWIEPELEARVTAWVLGEASAFEIAELERLVVEKPELAILKRRIEAAHELAGAAFRPDKPALRLAPERRQKLLATLGANPPAARAKVSVFRRGRPVWLSTEWLGRIAACLVVGAVALTVLSSIFSNRKPELLSGLVSGDGGSSEGFATQDESKPRIRLPVAKSEEQTETLAKEAEPMV